LVAPKGTRLLIEGRYDNSPNNPFNPDATKAIGFGEQSWDEMMFGFFEVAVPPATNPMQLMRPPQDKKATSAPLQ